MYHLCIFLHKLSIQIEQKTAQTGFALNEQEKDELIARLRAFVKVRGGRVPAAALWGVSERTLAGYLSGESDPKLSFLSKVALTEGVSVAELFMPRAENRTNAQHDAISIPMRENLAPATMQQGDSFGPVVGHMQFPALFVLSWGRSPDRVEVIQARGDSMFPTIRDGQWVFIDRADTELVDGFVYGFETSDGLQLRRFQKAIGGLPMLVSDNRDVYAPERLSSQDLKTLVVAGRAFLTPRFI